MFYDQWLLGFEVITHNSERPMSIGDGGAHIRGPTPTSCAFPQRRTFP